MKRRSGWLIVGAMLVWAGVVRAPAMLAFPHRAQVGAVTVHAVQPIDPAINVVVARADLLLAASPW